MRGRLSQSSISHFLCRKRDDGQYLHHNIHGYGRHCCSGWYFGIDHKSKKEVLDAVGYIDESLLISVDIFSRLEKIHVRIAAKYKRNGHDQEQNADSRKNCICWWEYLTDDC